MSNTLGPLPNPVEVSRYTKGEELRITHAYTTAQMEAERLRCYALGVAHMRDLCVKIVEQTYYPDCKAAVAIRKADVIG
jgi:hypothetical protein